MLIKTIWSMTWTICKMKTGALINGFILVAMSLLLTACHKETESSGISEGEPLRFMIGSSEIETRVTYGYKLENGTQIIRWHVGDDIHLIVYDPDDFSKKQSSIYTVTSVMSDVSEDGAHGVIGIIEPKEGQPQLVYHQNQSKVVGYYLPGIEGTWQWYPDGGSYDKGLLYYTIYQTQDRNYLDDLHPTYTTNDDWDIESNMKLAYMCAEPTTISETGVVSLHFRPMFTAFQITIKNPSDYIRCVNYVALWDSREIAWTTGRMSIQDLRDPFGQLRNSDNYLTNGSNNGYAETAYISSINPAEGLEGHNREYFMEIMPHGSGRFILFCRPFYFSTESSSMSIEVIHDGTDWANYYRQTTTEYPLDFMSVNNFWLTGGCKKYFITLTLPEP